MAPFEEEPMTNEQVRDAMVLIWDHLVKDLLAEIDRPHVIMASDPQAVGSTFLIGPFPDGFSAVAAAEKALSDDGLGAGFTRYEVVPLEAP